MLLFAPNLNSYRRFQRGTHAPLAPTWGYENRTVAVRVPADAPAAKKEEEPEVDADGQPVVRDDDEDDEDDQANLSLAAMEAALKPQVLETLDRIAAALEERQDWSVIGGDFQFHAG